MQRLRLDVWSDIACPWCYIGKRHLEAALASFAHAASVDVVWRAFELDPAAPRVHDGTLSYAARIAAKYRVSAAQGQVMIDRVIDAGKRAGLAFRYDHIKSGNTFDAHRLLHWALAHGKQGELKERLLHAYMTEGQAIGEPAVLAALAADVGLPATEATAILAGDRYAREVRDDEALARELGITGVPFFVMAGRIGVSGAQPVEVLAQALAQAWAEGATSVDDVATDGPTCGPDGCV
ncbi:MAG: DsbA family oxidoreductase [Proteobacteria bacterium]|nr:DsbA family oxidoreductase [Pseudomonadota bacterium]